MRHLKIFEKFYDVYDIVWCGKLNDDFYYEPHSDQYGELYSKDIPFFDTEKECQEWCDEQPQRIDLKMKKTTDKYNL